MCLDLRKEYGEAAKLRNDTRFKGEEFVRLDGVHLQEVDAGLYKLPWQDASNEREGLAVSLSEAQTQLDRLEEMMRSGASGHRYSAVLTDPSLDQNIQNNAVITRHVANTSKDAVETMAVSTEGVRTALDLASWLDRLGGAKASVAQLTARLESTTRSEKFLRSDEGFRTQRAEISRQLAWLQIAEHCRADSELNYDRRMSRIKASFDENLVALVERIKPIEIGLRNVYGIDVPLEVPPVGKIVETVAVWLVVAQNELSKFKRGQRLSLCTIIATGAPRDDGTGLDCSFDVSQSDIPHNALLRGIALEYFGENRGPITLEVSPPADAWSGNTATGALVVGRVGQYSPSLDLKAQHQDALWNGSCTGTWSVRVTTRGESQSLQLAMHLWVLSA